MDKNCYNSVYGADFKLDVGLYRLYQQVACQRYRQTIVDAEKVSRGDLIKELAAKLSPAQAFATV